MYTYLLKALKVLSYSSHGLGRLVLYNVGATWSLLNTSCTRFVTEDAVRIGNSFITILHVVTTITSYTVTRLHNSIILTRSWLQSLITLLHIYTGWLLSYQLLSQIITDFPCLSPIETSLVGLLLTNWLCIVAGLQNISSARTPRKRSLYCWPVLAIPSNGHCVDSLAVAGATNHKHSSHCCVWQDGGSSPGNHVNTCDVIAAARNLVCRPVPRNELRNQQWVDMSQYVSLSASVYLSEQL
jgi:hypothetical protein